MAIFTPGFNQIYIFMSVYSILCSHNIVHVHLIATVSIYYLCTFCPKDSQSLESHIIMELFQGQSGIVRWQLLNFSRPTSRSCTFAILSLSPDLACYRLLFFLPFLIFLYQGSDDLQVVIFENRKPTPKIIRYFC